MKDLPQSGLARRVEECCLNGWPAISEIVYDGWILRFSEGHTRRANSVNPLWLGSLDHPEKKIQYCEKLYAAHGLPTIFRVSTVIGNELDLTLDKLGYSPAEDETLMLHKSIDSRTSFLEKVVELNETMPSDMWLKTLARLQSQSQIAQLTHRKIVESIAVPAVFASVRADDGSLAALAFGAVHNGMVCVNSVATDPQFRRMGFARQAIQAVLDWSYCKAEAREACVPVVANNHPAVSLYRSLGFLEEIGRYHYRRQSVALSALS